MVAGRYLPTHHLLTLDGVGLHLFVNNPLEVVQILQLPMQAHTGDTLDYVEKEGI